MSGLDAILLFCAFEVHVKNIIKNNIKCLVFKLLTFILKLIIFAQKEVQKVKGAKS